MSTLSVTQIVTGSDTTDQSIATGNTAAGKIAIFSAGGMTLYSNSVTNAISITATGNVGISNSAPTHKLSVAGTLAAGNTTVTGFVNATSTIQGGAGLTIAGAASGITTLAAGNTTLTGSLSLSDRISQTGTVTNAAGYIQLGGQLNIATTSQQNMFTMQSQVSPQAAGGTLTSLYGLLFLPTIVSSANNISAIYPVFARVDSLASYTGTVNDIFTITAATPSWGSATAITNVYQFSAQNATATGNVIGFRSQITAGANKWNFYASSGANNYMAGGLGIGTSSLNATLTVSGTANVSGNINAASYTVGTAFVANSTGITTTGFANVAGVVAMSSYTEQTNTAVISTGTLTINAAAATTFDVSLNANVATWAFQNLAASGKVSTFTIVFTADGTARTITWPSAVKWPSNTAPTLTSTLNKKDIFTFFTEDAGTTILAFASGQNCG